MAVAMHEFQAIEDLLAHVLRQAQRLNAAEVKGVHVALGELSAFTEDSFASSWLALSAGTAAKNALLHFRAVTAAAQCMTCFRPYHPDDGAIRCPFCGGLGARIVAGQELYVEAIDFE